MSHYDDSILPTERKETRRNEIIAVIQILLSFFIFASLIFSTDDYNKVGPVGHYLREILVFLFGIYVCYMIPILMLLSGLSLIFVSIGGIKNLKNPNLPAYQKAGEQQKINYHASSLFRLKISRKVLVNIVSFSAIIISLCCLLSLPYVYDGDHSTGFKRGGMVGCFIMDQDGLGISFMLGYLGSTLCFSGILILAILLSSNVLIIDLIKGGIVTFTKGADLCEEWMSGVLGFGKSILAGAGRVKNVFSSSNASAVLDNEEDLDDVDEIDKNPEEDFDVAPIAPKVFQPYSPMFEDEKEPQDDSDDMQFNTSSFAADDDIRDYDKMEEYQDEIEDAQVNANYSLPPLTLLENPPRTESRMPEDELRKLSETLEKTLADFSISAQVVLITQGPVVTRFELQPAPGVRINKIVCLENDIAMALEASHVRIIAPIPGKATVGIEVPKKKASRVFLKEILSCEDMRANPSPLAFALGKTISGDPYVCNLASMPHLLIAGATGSGKSVCLNSIIMSILFRQPPEKVKFIMIDPKRVELSIYQDIPHLLAPVVYEPRKAASALQWAIEQMEERYKKLLSAGVRNIGGYNSLVEGKTVSHRAKTKNLEYMPHIIIVVDELADLMIVAKNDVEEYIIRLAQLSRAVGMHLIIATQRPSVNVITGIIKANFPTRIAFQVSSKVDSRTILDMNGAETLLGRGDMLFSQAGMPKPHRVQGAYVSDEEVERSVEYILSQRRAKYVKEDFAVKIVQEQLTFDAELGLEYPEDAKHHGTPPSPVDEYYNDEELAFQAAKMILEYKKASVSLIQRRMKIGFARAGRLMDILEEKGIVGPYQGSKPREILVDPDEYLETLKSLGRFPE